MARMTSGNPNHCGSNAKLATAVASTVARMISGNPNHYGGNANPDAAVGSTLARMDLREL